jgi:hypothetical protein
MVNNFVSVLLDATALSIATLGITAIIIMTLSIRA